MQGHERSKGGWVSPRQDYGIFGQGEQGIWVGTGRTVRVIRSSKMDQRVKVRIGNRKVIETKQGFLEMRMGWGEVRVRVPVQGWIECNRKNPDSLTLLLYKPSALHLFCLLLWWLPPHFRGDGGGFWFKSFFYWMRNVSAFYHMLNTHLTAHDPALRSCRAWSRREYCYNCNTKSSLVPTPDLTMLMATKIFLYSEYPTLEHCHCHTLYPWPLSPYFRSSLFSVYSILVWTYSLAPCCACVRVTLLTKPQC